MRSRSCQIDLERATDRPRASQICSRSPQIGPGRAGNDGRWVTGPGTTGVGSPGRERRASGHRAGNDGRWVTGPGSPSVGAPQQATIPDTGSWEHCKFSSKNAASEPDGAKRYDPRTCPQNTASELEEAKKTLPLHLPSIVAAKSLLALSDQSPRERSAPLQRNAL